jgi:predicted XRE-type DNA-binding protein
MQPSVESRADLPGDTGPRPRFEDDQRHVNVALGQRIADAIRELGLTQFEAANALGIDQPKVSRLLRGRLGEFSTARLLRFLSLLGRDVEIVVYPPGPRPHHTGRLRVAAQGNRQCHDPVAPGLAAIPAPSPTRNLVTLAWCATMTGGDSAT